jgi:hypothetical protein
MSARASLFAARPFARLFGSLGGSSDHNAAVAELHWPDHRVVQISSYAPDDSGVLIRVWQAGGTAEYGGTNLTLLSAALKFTDDGGIEIESLDVRKPWKASE